MVSARETEKEIIACCCDVAERKTVYINEAAANVLNLSASLLKREFPISSTAMQAASDLYFATAEHPRLTAAQILQKNWIISLPRLKSRLAIALKIKAAK